ncbi:MAG: hypothetical protein MJ252_15365 [archaeon]|nr:hypothetical protein [archaeon]
MSKQVTKTDKNKGKANDKKKEDKKEEEFEEMTGTGTFFYPNGNIYEGEYKQLTTGVKIREGKGKYIISPSEDNPNGIERYEGDWKEDKMTGNGIYYYSNGEIYEGEWLNDMQHGKGTYKFANGTCYVGEWSEHKMNGEGRFINIDEKGFEGVFVKGEFHTANQSSLLDDKRIQKKIEEMKGLSQNFLKDWEEVFSKADKKTIKDVLTPFFATNENMGKYVKSTYPKFEDKGADKWNEAIKFAFGIGGKAAKGGEEIKPEVNINIPTNEEDLIFMEKDSLLVPQIQEELTSGQVIEILSSLESRKVSLGIAYSKELEKWLIVFFNDVTEKANTKK